MHNPKPTPKGSSHPLWGLFFCLPNLFVIGLFWLIGATGEWGLLLPALMLGTGSVGALYSQRHTRPQALSRMVVLMCSLFVAASVAFALAGTLALSVWLVLLIGSGVVSCLMAYELATC